MSDDKVPIKLTEIITASDLPDDIEMKRKRLIASMLRHGVVDPNIEEGWIANHGRALIGTGTGRAFELTADQQERRRQEQAALGGAVLSKLVGLSIDPTLLADDSGPAAKRAGEVKAEAARADTAEAELAAAKARIAELEQLAIRDAGEKAPGEVLKTANSGRK